MEIISSNKTVRFPQISLLGKLEVNCIADFFFLAASLAEQDLSSLTRDQTLPCCSGSTESLQWTPGKSLQCRLT